MRHCVGVAFTSESEDRPPPGAEEFFDFSVAELGEVVEDLVVVLVLHDDVLFSQNVLVLLSCHFSAR